MPVARAGSATVIATGYFRQHFFRLVLVQNNLNKEKHMLIFYVSSIMRKMLPEHIKNIENMISNVRFELNSSLWSMSQKLSLASPLV